jgi:hypothetical protein
MSVTTQSNRSFIEAEQYSDHILTNLHDGLLPSNFYRNVSDFGNGEVLNIKTMGDAQIQEVEEDAPIKYSPIETGEVELRISEYIGDGWYVTDKMRQDGAQIEALLSQRGSEATRAIQEYFETQALKTLNDGQTDDDDNNVNGFAHRLVGSGGSNTIDLADLISMRLAFNKAQVPYGGRIAIVDPVVEATLNTKFNITADAGSNVANMGNLGASGATQGIFENGFDRDHSFVTTLYGWSIITSNRLPTGTFGTTGDTANAGSVANIFMCVADDNCKPLMSAWRQTPRVEGERNKDLQRDEYVQTARFGFGIQRKDTLGVIITSATAV